MDFCFGFSYLTVCKVFVDCRDMVMKPIHHEVDVAHPLGFLCRNTFHLSSMAFRKLCPRLWSIPLMSR